MIEQPFRHDERYTTFIPRIEVFTPAGKAFFIEPTFPHSFRKVWVGEEKATNKLVIIDRK